MSQEPPSDPEERFDLPEGEQFKAEGMSTAAAHRKANLEVAQQIARYLGRKGDLVSADDVQKIMLRMGRPPLRNAAGSIFKPSKDWEFMGWAKSERVSNHAHENRLWRLRR